MSTEQDIRDIKQDLQRRSSDNISNFDSTKLFFLIIPLTLALMSIGVLYYKVESLVQEVRDANLKVLVREVDNNSDFRVATHMDVLNREVSDNTQFRKSQNAVAISFTKLTNNIDNIQSRDLPVMDRAIKAIDVRVSDLDIQVESVREEIVTVRDEASTEAADSAFVLEDMRNQVSTFKKRTDEVIKRYNDWADTNSVNKPTNIR